MVLVLNAQRLYCKTQKSKTALYVQCQDAQVKKCECVRETETLSLSPSVQAVVCPLQLYIAVYRVRKIIDDLSSVRMDYLLPTEPTQHKVLANSDFSGGICKLKCDVNILTHMEL